MPAWLVASRPRTAVAISPLTFATAFVTPLPRKASPPSRSSVASYSPVEAPDGTAARPHAPERRLSSDLDRRVAPAVEDLACVDVLDLAHAVRSPGRGRMMVVAPCMRARA